MKKKSIIILCAVALVALIVVVAGKDMWFGGFHFGPPEVGPLPSEASWVKVDATVNKDSYSLGEDIVIELTFQNNSTDVFPIEPFPPKIMVMPSTRYGLVIREFPEGTGAKSLEPGEMASYILTWNQRDKNRQQVPAGDYKLALGNINAWNQRFMLTLDKPVEITITPPSETTSNAVDAIEVIAIFPAESGSPPPTSGWAMPGAPANPHPDRVQRVFSLGDKMYLGLMISNEIETSVTFSRLTYFNNETGEEIEVGLPDDLMRAWEPGQVGLLAFNNPWSVPEEPGEYQVRVYLDNEVIASARFEVSPKVSRQPVVMVKSQLKGGRFGQSSGFIFRSNGNILAFLADASEIEQLEVVLGNGLPLEASVSRTDNTTGLASIKIERNNLIPFTLAGNNEIAELKTGTHLVAAGFGNGEYREIEVEVLDTKYDLPLPGGTELRVMKLNTGGEPGMAGGPVVNDAGHVVGVMLAVDPKTGESFMVPINRIPSVLFLPTTAQEGTSDIRPITREQAIETAVRGLPPSIVARSDIKAEVHGWYWEITFDNLNARADELMPYPLKPPPPPAPGQSASEPYPGIWQSVIITVDAQTGDSRSTSARRAPRPGPYVSQEQAIESARERVLGFPMDPSWIARAKVEAYLQGDTWIVLFWEEGSEDNRLKAWVDAVTGECTGVGVG